MVDGLGRSSEPSNPSSMAASADERKGVFVDRGATIYGPVVGVNRGTVVFTAADSVFDVRGLPNPYLGLRSFTYSDSASYVGRASLVQDAVSKLTTPGQQRALLFVTGASGSGKSSFAQAGLVPALEAYYRKRRLKVRHAVIRPSKHPLNQLADALTQLGVDVPDVPAEAPTSLWELVLNGSPARQRNVIVLDQFEELFSQSETSERDTVLAWLEQLPPYGRYRTHIVATVRSDYLPELYGCKAIYETAKQGVDLRAMDAAELVDVIRRPLQLTCPDGDKRFEDELLRDLAQDASGDATSLPLLQVTLVDLWERGLLKRTAYGALSDAIRDHAERVYAFEDYAVACAEPRPAAAQREMTRIFLDLISVSLSADVRRDVRRRSTRADLVSGSEVRRALIDDLLGARLLRQESEYQGDQQVEMVDIIHETLIVRWQRLSDWVESYRASLQQRERFRQALDAWRAHGQSDAYLLDGVWLAEAKALALEGSASVSGELARAFLEQSQYVQETEQRRELEQARALAVAEGKRADAQKQLAQRQRIILVALLVVTAVVIGIMVRRAWARWDAQRLGQLVHVPALAIGAERIEVTNRQYAHCVAVGPCVAPPGSLNQAFFQASGGDLPVTGVDALQAASYCDWVGRRLPTLEEWESLAGQRARPDWPPGAYERLVAEANFLPGGPNPKAALLAASLGARASPDGVSDLLGNVWEWTATSWLETEQPGPRWDGTPEHAPAWLAAKGGSIGMTSTAHADTHAYSVSFRSGDLGFRCVEGPAGAVKGTGELP